MLDGEQIVVPENFHEREQPHQNLQVLTVRLDQRLRHVRHEIELDSDAPRLVSQREPLKRAQIDELAEFVNAERVFEDVVPNEKLFVAIQKFLVKFLVVFVLILFVFHTKFAVAKKNAHHSIVEKRIYFLPEKQIGCFATVFRVVVKNIVRRVYDLRNFHILTLAQNFVELVVQMLLFALRHEILQNNQKRLKNRVEQNLRLKKLVQNHHRIQIRKIRLVRFVDVAQTPVHKINRLVLRIVQFRTVAVENFFDFLELVQIDVADVFFRDENLFELAFELLFLVRVVPAKIVTKFTYFHTVAVQIVNKMLRANVQFKKITNVQRQIRRIAFRLMIVHRARTANFFMFAFRVFFAPFVRFVTLRHATLTKRKFLFFVTVFAIIIIHRNFICSVVFKWTFYFY